MGWASGSGLAEEVWDVTRPYVRDQDREKVANAIIDAFENMDCDTMEECEQLMEDAKRPETCWDCGNEFDRGTLTEDGLCNKCDKENENE